jgi:hypothetical protein
LLSNTRKIALGIEAGTFGFIERCGVHGNSKELLDDLLRTVKSFGFEHLILSGVPLGGQKLAPMVELNGWPSGWFERYVKQEHAAVDGVCIWSRQISPSLLLVGRSRQMVGHERVAAGCKRSNRVRYPKRVRGADAFT